MSPDLLDRLIAWRAAGLISADQERAIERFEIARAAVPAVPASTAETGRRGRVPAVAEALGYLGGVLAIIGLVSFVARLWEDMAVGTRFGLAAAAAVAMFLAGLAVPEHAEPALSRLRGFIWALSSAATAVAAAVFAHSIIGGTDPDPGMVVFVTSSITAVQAGSLWRRRDRAFQQVCTLAATAAAFGSGLTWAGSSLAASLAVWALGVVVVVAAVRRIVAFPVLSGLSGAIVAMAGTVIAAVEVTSFGVLFAAATAIALVWLGVESSQVETRWERRAYTVFGIAMVVQSVPQAIAYYADDAGLVTGAVVSSAGIGLGVVAARGLTRKPVPLLIVGAVTALVGAAVIGAQNQTVATLWGLAVSVAMLAAAMRPGRSVLSVFGSLGLLVNVPWAIDHFFPGGGRAPLLILVAGALLIGAAVLITRLAGRIRSELSGGAPPDVSAPSGGGLPPPVAPASRGR